MNTWHVQLKTVQGCAWVRVLWQKKNHHRPLNRSHIYAQVNISYMPRIPWAAVSQSPTCHCLTWIRGFSLWSKDTRIVWQEVLIIFQMFECFPLHSIRLSPVSSQTAIRMKRMPRNFHTFRLLKKALKGPFSCQMMCGQL
jgi:hypothetical protein